MKPEGVQIAGAIICVVLVALVPAAHWNPGMASLGLMFVGIPMVLGSTWWAIGTAPGQLPRWRRKLYVAGIALLTFMFLLTVVAAAGDFMRSPELMPHKAGVLISGWAIFCVSLILVLLGKGWGRLAPPIAALSCVLLWTFQFFWD